MHNFFYICVRERIIAAAKYGSGYAKLVECKSDDRNFETLRELDRRDYEIVDTFNPDHIFYFFVVDGHNLCK